MAKKNGGSCILDEIDNEVVSFLMHIPMFLIVMSVIYSVAKHHFLSAIACLFDLNFPKDQS